MFLILCSPLNPLIFVVLSVKRRREKAVQYPPESYLCPTSTQFSDEGFYGVENEGYKEESFCD